ncbi:MAG: AMP-binding protein [bacterium]
MQNLYARLDAAFTAHSDKPCLILDDHNIWKFKDLRRAVAVAVQRLGELGVRPGDRVVVQVEKSPYNLALYLATLCVGGVYVPLNTAYTDAELQYFVEDAAPALFVGSRARTDVTSATLDAQGGGSFFAELPVITVSDSDDQQGLLIEPREGDDLAAILYTSGTTGRSKGAMLSHANLMTNAQALIAAWGWQADDVLLHALPIFHVHGLFIASHCALLSGTPMRWMNKFDADRVQHALADCTVMMGVPTFYTRLLALPDFPVVKLDHMRLFICGSAPLTEQVFEQWRSRTGHTILERYGMSETIINTSNPLHGDRLPATVGFALPGLELRIADDRGQTLPAGEVGTIEVKGPSVFCGYWRMPEKTASEFREDGYFITGDLGTMDAEGRLSIVGRAKDLVISGGYNIYPKEVERALDEMPEVSESAVIGVPHPDFGEALVAVIVPTGAPVNLAQIDAALAGQLARFKQPKRVVNVAELPRNTMGKVQKNILRDTYEGIIQDMVD